MLKINWNQYDPPASPCRPRWFNGFNKDYISPKDFEYFAQYVKDNRFDKGLINLIEQSHKRMSTEYEFVQNLRNQFLHAEEMEKSAKTNKDKLYYDCLKRVYLSALSAASRESGFFELENYSVKYKGMVGIVEYDETKERPIIKEEYMLNRQYESVHFVNNNVKIGETFSIPSNHVKNN